MGLQMRTFPRNARDLERCVLVNGSKRELFLSSSRMIATSLVLLIVALVQGLGGGGGYYARSLFDGTVLEAQSRRDRLPPSGWNFLFRQPFQQRG
jgi:hypothetical protein